MGRTKSNGRKVTDSYLSQSFPELKKPENTKELMNNEEWKEFCKKRRKANSSDNS